MELRLFLVIVIYLKSHPYRIFMHAYANILEYLMLARKG